jgi:single-strand DNA-binding protein
MAGINRVILVGNLGKDPEIMTFDNGVKKASFSLATTESYKNKEGAKVDQTEWHNIVVWRGLAEVAEKYLRKGSQIYLEGKIKTRSYEQDGIKKYITEIYGDNFTMLGGRREGGEVPNDHVSQPPAAQQETPEMEAPQDDLPF